MSKSLVVYFSRGDEEYGVGKVNPGNTELLAKEIVRRTGADEFKIVPVMKYPESYMDCVELATREKEEQARPEYVGDVELADYDTIFLGYPIWWGDLPMIVYSFIEKHDWSGKVVVPFNTHEGSGNSGTYQVLQKVLSSADVRGGGFNMSGSTVRTDEGMRRLNEWLDEITR